MDKQTTLAFVLIGLILISWLYINSPEPVPVNPSKADSSIVAEKNDTIIAPSSEKKSEVIEQQIVKSDIPEKIYTVETEKARFEITSKGGKLRRVFLKEFKTWYYSEYPDSVYYRREVQLINSKFDGGELDVVFVTKNGELVNSSALDFSPPSEKSPYILAAGDSLEFVLSADLSQGGELKRTLKFKGDLYEIGFSVEITGMGSYLSGGSYDLVWANGLNFVEKNTVDEANYSSASVYSGEEQIIIDASGDEAVSKEAAGKIDWVGIKTKYFGMIMSPDKPDADGGAYLSGNRNESPTLGPREYYTARLKVPFQGKDYQKDNFSIYIGPLQYDLLSSYEKSYEVIYDFGSFFGLKFITRPISEYILLPLFTFLHRFIPNYGWVIIIFSIIIKLILTPLTKQSYTSIKKMQLLQPKMKELKEKYKDDPAKQQKELMGLYSTYGVSPFGGCLPMLLQMPILIALFTFFNVAVEIRNEPFVWWITNLAAPDVIFRLPFAIPLFGIQIISGTALLLGVSMFLQQKMTTTDPSQKALVYIMPVMLTILFMTFPAGLNIYYLMFNFLSYGQQLYINKRNDGTELVPVEKSKRKSGGFMQRMMEMAEQQKHAQKNPPKKKKKF